jgi:hypothetical protein
MRKLRRHSPPAPPAATDFIFRTAVHEAIWTPVPMPPNTPTAGVRLMVQDQGEVTQRGNRAKALWNAGVWAYPCLRTHWTTESTGPSSVEYQGGVESPTRQFYRSKVAQLLNLMDAPAVVGGPKVQRGEIFEVNNEPNTNATIQRALRALAGSYDLIRASGRKVVWGHCLGGGSPYAMSLLTDPALNSNPNSITGGANLSMIDAWARHVYNDSPSFIVNNNLSSLRTLLDNNGAAGMAIHVTENGWVQDRLGNVSSGPPFNRTYTAAEQRDRIEALWGLFAANGFQKVRDLILHSWTYFAYSDYNPGDPTFGNHCGLVEQDTRLSTYPNYQTLGGPGTPNPSWKPHPVPYDARAKGAGTAGPPPHLTAPIWGLALKSVRDFPKETAISL